MKLVSYNIFEGARGESGSRIERIIGVIKGADADLVGLCECRGFWDDDAALLKQVEASLGMKSVMNHAASGNHVALLYRESARVVAEDASSASMHHGYASVVTVLPKVGRTAVVMTHLHPRSVILRLAEAQTVLVKAAFEPNAIVMGDLNALAEADEAAVGSLLSLKDQVRLLDRTGTVRSSVVSLFTKYGFVDLGAADGVPTCPTKLVEDPAVKETPLRLDYVLATSRLANIARLSTITTANAQTASDHLPLLCELMMAP